MRALRALPLLLLAAACAGGGRGCPAVLVNASQLPVEQFYLARARAEGWGTDLVAAAELALGATLPVRFEGEGRYGLRAVWANGRAVEMQNIEGCRVARITVRDDALQVE